MTSMIPKQLELVTQRTDKDCGIACAAMVTGLPYEEVYEALGPGPVCDDESARFYVQNNVLPQPQLSGGRFLWGGLYEAAVPSKNFPARTHLIVIDLRDGSSFLVFDPQQGTGNKYWTTEDFLGDNGIASWCAITQMIDCSEPVNG